MINRLQETSQTIAVQDTTFAVDVMGRYMCNTWDEAVNNGGIAFDAVVIGAGMFGAYCAEKIWVWLFFDTVHLMISRCGTRRECCVWPGWETVPRRAA